MNIITKSKLFKFAGHILGGGLSTTGNGIAYVGKGTAHAGRVAGGAIISSTAFAGRHLENGGASCQEAGANLAGKLGKKADIEAKRAAVQKAAAAVTLAEGDLFQVDIASEANKNNAEQALSNAEAIETARKAAQQAALDARERLKTAELELEASLPTQKETSEEEEAPVIPATVMASA